MFKKKKFWIFLLIVVALFFINCSSCGTGCGCNCGSTLDLSNDFSSDEIDLWKKQNKEEKNEYVLNGGYYIHFKGVNYPVVFTEGKITRFDNMPDELFFVDMWELFTDSSCKHRCAFQGWYREYYSFFKEAVDWDGFMLDGKRPKNGTILYVDESNERKFMVNLHDYESELFGPDDPIPLSSSYIYGVNGDNTVILLSNEDGTLDEETNTVRKLWYRAKQLGVAFDCKGEFINIAYYPSFFYVDEFRHAYSYSNDWTDGETFKEKDLKAEKEESYTGLRISSYSISNRINLTVDYRNEDLPNERYTVLLNSAAASDFEKNIKDNGRYSNVVRDGDGQVISYSFGGESYKVFNGTLDEFSEFLTNDVIDEKNGTAISYFTSSENSKTDFRKSYLEKDGVIKAYSSYLCAVWDTYKTVILRGEEDSKAIICKNKECVLPRPKKAGYEFVGWYTNSDFTGEAISKIAYTDDYTELYAKFKAVDYYTIVLEPYNGQEFEEIRYSYGDEIQLPLLTKAFYLFEGWCTDSECLSEPIKFISSDFFGNYHLYPCFTPREYSITIFDSDIVTEKVRYGEEFTLSIPNKKDGFLGYFDAYGVQYTDENGKSLKPFTDGADIQLFAKYKTEDI